MERATQGGMRVPAMDIPEYIPRWSGQEPNAEISSGLMSPNTGCWVGTLYVGPDGKPAGGRLSEGRPHVSFHDVGLKGFVVPDNATPDEVRRQAREWEERSDKNRAQFKQWGMVEPRENRGGPDLHTVIDWLFLLVKPPGLSWGELAIRINAGLQDRRDYWERLMEEYPEDSAGILRELGTVHDEYTPQAVAHHVNGLRKSLLIKRAPGTKEKFG